MKTKYIFSDEVIVEDDLVGVVVKTWHKGDGYEYEIYVRYYNAIKLYNEENIDRYRVKHKQLSEEDLFYQNLN